MVTTAGLTEAELTDCRRFLGYGAFGAARGAHGGWWFYQAAAAVDVRLQTLSDSEVGVLRGYLGTLGALEAAIPGAADGLDTASAAGWVRNPAEVAERERLFDNWRRRLAGFLGVQPGPDLRAGGNTVALVV